MSETTKCRLCGKPTGRPGTELCDGCWELESRIKDNPGMAARILQSLRAPEEGQVMSLKDKALGHLDSAKGEVDAAWSMLHEADDITNALRVAKLGESVDGITEAVRNSDIVTCNVCLEPIKSQDPCFQLRQGIIEEDNVTFLPNEDLGFYHQICLAGLP